MKSFQFPLQRVLDWRALHARTEEEKLARLQYQLATLVHRENSLIAAELKSELGLLNQPSIAGRELQALASFQLKINSERASLKASRAVCEAQIVEQRKRVVLARRDCRALEKLKDKRWRTWVYLSDREVEETAAENYISRWARSDNER